MLIDGVVGILVIYICWRAFRQGFARQTIQLAGLGLGVCAAEPAAVKLSPWASKQITQVPQPLHGAVLALASLFIVWLVVSTIGSWMLASYRRRVHGENVPSLGDNLFGVGVGAVKAAFFVSLIVFGFEQLPESFRKLSPVDEQVSQSKSVSVAREFHLVERLIAVHEVQAVGKRMQELVEYFRKTDDLKGEPQPPTAPQLSALGDAETK
jgi:uncharacterized membrane protein required for colicin V production